MKRNLCLCIVLALFAGKWWVKQPSILNVMAASAEKNVFTPGCNSIRSSTLICAARSATGRAGR